MIANPALTQEEGLKGVFVGGGEWDAFFAPDVGGNTSMSVRVNFPGNASGGHVLVTTNYGDYFLVEVDPEFSSIKYGTWNVMGGFTVTGYAFWGIGLTVDTNIEGLKDSWCLVGGYDGSESDYLLAFHGWFPPFDWETVEALYEEALEGNNFPLWVVLVKGNVKINVME